MERMSIKAYAVKHQLSMFNVMKMIKSGKVKSEVFQEKGRDVTYILYDEQSENKIKEQIIHIENKQEVQVLEILRILTQEVQALRKEIEELKEKL